MSKTASKSTAADRIILQSGLTNSIEHLRNSLSFIYHEMMMMMANINRFASAQQRRRKSADVLEKLPFQPDTPRPQLANDPTRDSTGGECGRGSAVSRVDETEDLYQPDLAFGILLRRQYLMVPRPIFAFSSL